MQRIQLTYQRQEWSRDAWALARRVAAESPPGDPKVQAEVAACLAGLDAHKFKSFPLPGTGLAFDPSGRHLMISGSSTIKSGPEQPVQIWDSKTDQLQPAEIKGKGTFRVPARRNIPVPDRPRVRAFDCAICGTYPKCAC